MRELRFRVWDKMENRFIYPDKGYKGHFMLTLDGRFQNFQNGSGGDDYVIQQFTGVKDKNDNEIYEGDILLYGEFQKEIGTVEFFAGSFRVTWKDEEIDDELGGMFINQMEVIGNIFEN